MINKQETHELKRGVGQGDEKIMSEKMAETQRNPIRPNSNMIEILAGSNTHRG